MIETELEVWPLPREYPAPHRIQFSNEQTARSGFGGDHDYFGLYTCSECSALVLNDGFEKHRIFHDKMEELIEWAQSMSQMMVGEANAPES